MIKMMGLLGNKSFISVLVNKDNAENETKKPSEDTEEIDPDQGIIDASKEMLKAIEKKDPERIARCFKAMMVAFKEQHEMDEEDSEY